MVHIFGARHQLRNQIKIRPARQAIGLADFLLQILETQEQILETSEQILDT